MITSALLSSLYWLLYGILALIPTAPSLPVALTTAIGLMFSYMASYSWVINVDALFACVAWVISFELGLVSVKGVLWLIKTVRGSG